MLSETSLDFSLHGTFKISKNLEILKSSKKQLTRPMHWPTHGQWWSNFWIQLLQMEQCEARGGRYNRQVSQNFTLILWPLTIRSFVRGNFTSVILLLTHSIDWEGMPTDSSDSGGWQFLGIIPGSLPDVMKRNTKSCMTFLLNSEIIFWTRPVITNKLHFTNHNSEDQSPN
jgi:hypothetical protein